MIFRFNTVHISYYFGLFINAIFCYNFADFIQVLADSTDFLSLLAILFIYFKIQYDTSFLCKTTRELSFYNLWLQ